jgi:hypothetical protein
VRLEAIQLPAVPRLLDEDDPLGPARVSRAAAEAADQVVIGDPVELEELGDPILLDGVRERRVDEFCQLPVAGQPQDLRDVASSELHTRPTLCPIRLGAGLDEVCG